MDALPDIGMTMVKMRRRCQQLHYLVISRAENTSGTEYYGVNNLLRRLDLTTLQLFLAIHEEGTLTRAVEREAIAVSAASKQLVEWVALGKP